MSIFGTQFLQNSEDLCYMASSGFFVPAALTTDAWEIKHNGGANLIQVLGIWLAYVAAGTTATVDVGYVFKNSTAASGGTAVSNTIVPLDSNNAAPVSAAVNHFTANPTTGTRVGRLTSFGLMPTLPGNGNGMPAAQGDFAMPVLILPPHSQAGVLRSNGQAISVNFNSIKPGAGTPQIAITTLFKEIAP